MARYIAIHTTPEGATQEELIAGAKQVVAALVGDAKWLNSWWIAGGADKMFCEWEAEDEEAIHASLEQVKDIIPIETVDLVTWINPEWFE